MYQKLKNLKTLEGNQSVMCNVLVKEELTKTPKPKPYLNVKLSDDDAEVYIKVWDKDDRYEEFQKIPVNSLIDATLSYDGVVKGYDQYSLHEYKIMQRPSLTDCVEIEPLKEELRKIISNEIKDKDLKELIFKLFANKELKELIFTSPLNEKSGYSFKGGLLAHIVRMCKLSLSIGNVYDEWNYNKDGFNEKINISLLLSASILSDIGVVLCYDMVNDVPTKTFKGNLNESSYYSAKILLDLLRDSKMSEEKKDYLEHVVTSAKGRLNYGALNTPRSKEANIFHYIQRIDTMMGNFEYMDRIAFGEFCKLGAGENQKLYCVSDFDEL